VLVKRIKELCKRKGITLHRLEQETGLGNGIISRWEKSSPTVENLKKVADYFGVTIDMLIK